MKRHSLSLASGLLLLAAARCASTASSDSVTITKNEAAVSNCSRVAQVDVPSGMPDTGRNFALADAAHRGGGNTVLVTSDDARTGVAYRCNQPSLAGR
ncbi:MAG: hypothetical protein ABI682_11405 [Acidobacteriota bacterium]